MATRILFITSFAQDMYQESGKKLIESYLASGQEGDLLICYENMSGDFIPINPKITGMPLHQSAYLVGWLETNRAIIPARLGGIADENRDPRLRISHNRKASRWFRKVASLQYALATFGHQYDYLIWIDSDCIMTQNISITLITEAFAGVGMFYYHGVQREREDYGYETGFLGFSRADGGFAILRRWIEAYEGEFIRLRRWDDGYVLRKIDDRANSIDLNRDGRNKNPLEKNNLMHIFAGYVYHNKGVHRVKNILV